MSIIVYTAITAEHDPARDDIPCFTDWGKFGSSALAARFYKCAPHILFPEADWTIWVDGNIFLNVEPERLVDRVTQGGNPFATLGVFAHPSRDTVMEEAAAIVAAGFSSQEDVDKSLALYARAGLKFKLAMGGVLVRRNCFATNNANARWWQYICAGSLRDQLTLPLAYQLGPFSNLWAPVSITEPNPYFTRIP